MTLHMMLEKGIITQAEYDSAVKDLKETAGEHVSKEGTAVLGKWATTIYGFVEADNIWDSSRGLNDNPGNTLIQRPLGTPGSSLAGNNTQFTMGVRNSRFGIRFKAPEAHEIKVSGNFEMDFQGAQNATANTAAPGASEGNFWSAPAFRDRHLYVKVETPVVDVLMGQTWRLFGWQASYNPNTVEIQGIPAEIYSRTPQLRVSKTVKADPITFEAAVAAMRPVQRDSGWPDGEAGVRLAVDSWTGVQTTGPTGTQISPLSVAFTGLARHVAVNELLAKPVHTRDLGLLAGAVDAFVPVVKGTKDKKDNSFSLQGEFASGYGTADLYSALTGGFSNVGFVALPTGYSPDIDSGIVVYDTAGNLHGIQWTSYLFGAQYYFPGTDGKFWISGNYSHLESANSHYYAFPTVTGATVTQNTPKVRAALDWFDVNVFVDPATAFRLGLEYANTNDMYVDGIHAINHRVQLSGFFIF